MELYKSDKPTKRFLAIYEGKKYYFGQPNAYTFIDGADENVRENYWKRHYAIPTEKYRIDNLIPSPALFSAYILWNTDDIYENVRILNKLLKKEL
jgi:hypothetical protein